jgi:hypothetical protein
MKFFPQLFLNLGKRSLAECVAGRRLDVEESVEPDVEVETTAIADKMRNLQGCEEMQNTDVIE